MKRFARHFALWAGIAALLACGDAAAAGNAPAGGSGKAAAPASGEPIRVEKAKGKDAYTVGELHEKSGVLDKQTVSVRGKVVKATKTMIVGKYWVHLRDGSGDARKGTNDVVVATTEKPPQVGTVVTARGTLYKDKDLGAGYKYPIVIGEGSFQP